MYSGVSGSRSAISKGSVDASWWWVQQDRTGKKSRILIPPQPIEPTLCWVKNAFWSLHLKRRQTCYLLFNAKGDIFCSFLRPRFSSLSDPPPIVSPVLSFFLSPASLWHKEEWKNEMTKRSASSLNTGSVTGGRFSLQTHGLWFTLLLLDFHRKKDTNFSLSVHDYSVSVPLFSADWGLSFEIWNL